SVTVTSGTGITTTVEATITQLFFPEISAEVTSDFGGFNISCNGETDGSASATASSGEPPYQFLWSDGTTFPAADDLSAGIFSVTVTDANGCTDVGSVTLDEPEPLRITFSVSDIDCFGQNDGAIFVQAEGGVPPVRFSLNGGEFQEQSAFLHLTEGSYEVTAQDANGCETTELLLVNAPYPVDVELGDNVLLDLGDQTDLQAIINVPFDSLAAIVWANLDSSECPNCLSQPIAPLVTTSYAIQVTGNNGCPDDDNLTVFVDRRKSIFVPNAFSPNGDGTNDWLLVFANPKIVVNIKRFLVFSRWGETVFEYHDFQPNDPAFGWDGKHRGEALNAAVFVWFAEVEFVDGEVKIYEGDVTLMR
ncbi:MAG: gliding motility-associated C-terminal domain-containing protein, partial [Bacteroidota bacterium]